jgi:DNA-binding response OmpR family regulator
MKVDSVITSSEMALDLDSLLIMNIKKMNLNIKVLVVGDENSDKTMILDYGADEFALKPMSPENTADKVLMLLARDKMASVNALQLLMLRSTKGDSFSMSV